MTTPKESSTRVECVDLNALWPDHDVLIRNIEPGGGSLGLQSLGEGLGNLSRRTDAKAEAHQPVLRSFSGVGLFSERLPKLLNELNKVLAA